MKKPLFVKKSTNSKTKAVSSEGTNAALSSKPSYMLDVMGVNLATSKVYSEETTGEKAFISNNHLDMQEVNSDLNILFLKNRL